MPERRNRRSREPTPGFLRLQDVRVELVQAAPVGFDAVYEREYAGLVRLAYVTTGSVGAAEEVVQEVFIAWYRNGAHVLEPAAYLRRAVTSRCTSWVRRKVLERRHSSTEPYGPRVIDPVDADVVAVREALRQLRPRQRAAIFLRYYLDLPEAQIADALGCPPGTVKSLLHRSLAAMREVLGE